MSQRQAEKPAAPLPPMPAVVAASMLLRDRRELFIEHGEERYRLSLTKTGKLILTK